MNDYKKNYWKGIIKSIEEDIEFKSKPVIPLWVKIIFYAGFVIYIGFVYGKIFAGLVAGIFAIAFLLDKLEYNFNVFKYKTEQIIEVLIEHSVVQNKSQDGVNSKEK